MIEDEEYQLRLIPSEADGSRYTEVPEELYLEYLEVRPRWDAVQERLRKLGYTWTWGVNEGAE